MASENQIRCFRCKRTPDDGIPMVRQPNVEDVDHPEAWACVSHSSLRLGNSVLGLLALLEREFTQSKMH